MTKTNPTIRQKLLFALITLVFAQTLSAAPAIDPYPQVLITTTHGEFVLELDTARAPITVRNFLGLVKKGHYNGTIFHRVIKEFVAQAGGYDVNYNARPETPTIVNESGNGLSNQRGTIAMARHGDPHSAGAQFYINLANNERLDPREDRWGYTVFGNVIEGMETFDEIEQLPTGPAGELPSDVPAMPVIIKSTRILTMADIEKRAADELAAAEKLLSEFDN